MHPLGRQFVAQTWTLKDLTSSEPTFFILTFYQLKKGKPQLQERHAHANWRCARAQDELLQQLLSCTCDSNSDGQVLLDPKFLCTSQMLHQSILKCG